MDICVYLARHGGAARSLDLRKAGFTRTRVGQALELGLVARLRRGVYALPGDERIAGALAAGGRLTCLSAAPIYQLWVLNSPSALHLTRSHPTRTSGVVDHGRPKHPRHA